MSLLFKEGIVERQGGDPVGDNINPKISLTNLFFIEWKSPSLF